MNFLVLIQFSIRFYALVVPSRFPNRLIILSEDRILSRGQQKAFRTNSLKLFSNCQVQRLFLVRSVSVFDPCVNV